MLTNLMLIGLLFGSTGMTTEEYGPPVGELFPAPSAVVAPAEPVAPTVAEEDRVIEIAICLDTSGSMQGLINAAREKLWLIVNDLATASPAPKLRIALLQYGNDQISHENGWVKTMVPFTEDLDLLADSLFSLTTNGGTELVGRVVDVAADQLQWSKSDRTLKLIFVAGNESADQDQTVRFADACAKSIAKGIQVNSIYCGPGTDGIAPGWRNVAALADGHFAAIDQNKVIAQIATPMDEQMLKLSTEINGTTVPFGLKASWGESNQIRQDSNAVGCGTWIGATRAVTKCQGIYTNPSWDLVDAVREENFVFSDLGKDLLPKMFEGKSEVEIRLELDEKYAVRKKLQSEILELQKKREAFLAAERTKRALDTTDQFDVVVRSAIRAQAAAKGFVFADEVALIPLDTNKEAAPKAEDQ